MGPPAPQAPVASPSPAPAQPLAASVAGDVITAAPESVTNTALAEPQGQGLLGLLEALSPEEEKPAVASVVGDDAFRKARLAARKKADDDAKAKIVAETKSKLDAEAKLRKAEDDAKKAEARRNPERVWVQVATGSAKSGIGITVKRVREQAGDALKGAGAASVPYRATNRILMGPYASEGEARRVVNALAKKGVQATTFTSTAGQEIAKLSSK